MRLILAIMVAAVVQLSAFAQNERAPIIQKDLDYENWRYPNLAGEEKTDLREFVSGKKLVLVVYFAAWCHNWRHEAPFVQSMYEKYRKEGFSVIGVAEYESVENTRTGIGALGITFPVVLESTNSADRLKTSHYRYRTSVGDTRKWGSPWNIFIDPAAVNPKGDMLLKKAFLASGELIEAEAETFIREKLGLPKQTP